MYSSAGLKSSTMPASRQQALTQQALLIYLDHLLATYPICGRTAFLVYGAAASCNLCSLYFPEQWDDGYGFYAFLVRVTLESEMHGTDSEGSDDEPLALSDH